MNGAIKWMAHNHVAANLVMMLFIVGGLVMSFSIRQELFPEVLLDMIQISVVYPGASPEEIEDGIILQIEERIRGIHGIKEVKSVASEGRGTVTAEILSGQDADIILQDIRSEVERITTFPKDAEEPVIIKLVNRREVISVVVYGEMSEEALRQQAEAVRDDLLAFPQITQVELGGVRPYEISIEISEENLRRYGLTLEKVATRVRRASQDIPGGSIKVQGGEILVRTKEKRYRGEEYAGIVVIGYPDGTEVTLGEIGDVRDTFRETDQFARFDGMPAAMVSVFRVGEQKPIQISEMVRGYIEQRRKTIPSSVKLAVWNDRSEYLSSRMGLLKKNAVIGLVLVFINLSLFLQMRLALWVMLGIPISFLGALFIMPAIGVSINMISLFAFIMALGIVVDDAIVVGENIFEHRQRGKSYLQAAVDGAREVAVPVVFSVLTSVTAFLPLMYIAGTIGKFIRVIPFVVISILLISLIESLFVLPAHLSFGSHSVSAEGISGRLEQVRQWFTTRLEGFIRGPYRRLLEVSLEFRYATVAVAVAVMLISVGILKGGIIKFRFMPAVEGNTVRVELRMPRGTTVETTDKITRHIMEKGVETVEQIDREAGGHGSILRHMYTVVGGTIAKGGPGSTGQTASASYLANIGMFLVPSEERSVPALEVSHRWRANVGEIPGVEALVFKSSMVHMGENIDVRLAHKTGILDAAAETLKAVLAGYDGVTDIVDNRPAGKRELKIRLKPAARTMGITEEDLGRQVRSAFYGAEALRFQRGRDEIKVMVRYPEEFRKSMTGFDNLRIHTPDGGEMPLSEAAYIELGRGFSEINRAEQKRVINVTASVDNTEANAEEIIAELKKNVLPQMLKDYPGLSYDMEGEEKERKESMTSMMRGFSMALFGIYALLAIPFRSYSQPLLIMVAIPFGVIGAIAGHLIMRFDLSILSVFGIVALSGVVVNDSLLLIDQVNRNRMDGRGLMQALMDAGQRRFRPILLTSFTTYFGLAPMIFERSVQAQFLIPMAISLGYGILFATGITLLLIPSLYHVLEDVKAVYRRCCS